MRRITNGLSRRAAVRNPCTTYRAVAGPIAPRISSPVAARGVPTGADAGAGTEDGGTAIARAGAATSPATDSASAQSDALMACQDTPFRAEPDMPADQPSGFA